MPPAVHTTMFEVRSPRRETHTSLRKTTLANQVDTGVHVQAVLGFLVNSRYERVVGEQKAIGVLVWAMVHHFLVRSCNRTRRFQRGRVLHSLSQLFHNSNIGRFVWNLGRGIGVEAERLHDMWTAL